MKKSLAVLLSVLLIIALIPTTIADTFSTDNGIKYIVENEEVTIVGYTNAGKSTLMNAFIEEYSNNEKKINNKTVLAKDLLFATLDTSSRHIKFKDNKEIILTDTVGFISKLPHGLIRAFKSTLSETLIADLIILVADISSSDVLNQIQVTLDTLHEIGVSDETPIIYVFNKADKVGLATIPSNDNKMFISAKNHLNLK